MRKFLAPLKRKNPAVLLFLLAAFWFSGSLSQVFAHDGEDHGNEKPKTTASEKGTVSHTQRLGDLEVMIKHPLIEPDTPAAARLFITDFKTNQPAEKVNPTVEMESSSGSVTEIKIEKTDTAGSFNFRIPPLPNGVYILRAKVTYDGETDTATFSGIEVKSAPFASESSFPSWAQVALAIFIGLIILSSLGALVYFGLRSPKREQKREEAVSV